MEIYCTRPGCSTPQNFFADLDNKAALTTVQQKYCTTCGMPLILRGRYIPSKLLGKGGFGTAFLARDRDTPAMRQCVVKQFQPSVKLNSKELEIAQQLFVREAEVLEKLGSEHPQIPDLFAFFSLSISTSQPGKNEEFFYLVQEFIDGQDLEQELESKGKFSEKQALEVLLEILKVLKFVHENNSIHRDIKPSNIMRSRNGNFYLLDFGAVKQVSTSAVGTRSTGIYSQGYAPPEQMAGSQVYPSTDLYALAVTIITLLTGKDPGELYDPYGNQWIWRNHAQVSDTLEAVLNRMLLATPSERFQSAQEVIDSLQTRVKPSPPPPLQMPTTPPAGVAVPGQVKSSSPAQQPSPQAKPLAKRPAFSLVEILTGAAFTGFEGALLFLALGNLLPAAEISIGLWGMLMGGLIFAEFRRLIEKIDLLIIAAITLAAVVFIPALRPVPQLDVVVIAFLAGAAVVAVTALFRLIYQILSRLL
ncbi:MAG: serine/threonine-protein kinase [Coleofasciculaceae cyanobacterium]